MEKILCIRREDIPGDWLKKMGATALPSEVFYQRLNDIEPCWCDRSEAEKDAAFKQLIPYAILQLSPDQRIAAYQRNGSEKRLTDLWSIGIGGHINPIDDQTGGLMLEQIAANCLMREFSEETGLYLESRPVEFLGLINEEETSVGKVHLGLVYRIMAQNPEEIRPSEELANFQWTTVEEVKKLPLEHWSRLAMLLLDHKQPTDRLPTATLR